MHATWRVNGIANVSYINRNSARENSWNARSRKGKGEGARASELSDRWQSFEPSDVEGFSIHRPC